MGLTASAVPASPEVQARQGFRVKDARDLAPFRFQGDPLAQAVVEAFTKRRQDKGPKLFEDALTRPVSQVPGAPVELRNLFAQVETFPAWLNLDQLECGAEAYRRFGIKGGLVLACNALPLIYGSPSMSQPLLATEKLLKLATQRLTETGRFVAQTCLPRGLLPYQEGWKFTIKVRMRHATARLRLTPSTLKSWNPAWGIPLSQVDMAHVLLLFSVGHLDSLRRVGYHVSADEGQAAMHLWRYTGYLLGIEPELLCDTEEQGSALLKLIRSTDGSPDSNSRKLTEKLITEAIPATILEIDPRDTRWWRRLRRFAYTRFSYGLSYALIGAKRAAELAYPSNWWRYVARRLLWILIAPLEVLRRASPRIHQRIVRHTTKRILDWLDTHR